MRIEAYNQITSIYNTRKPAEVKGGYTISGRDEVRISQAGHAYQTAKRAVENSPDIREDKVACLKAKIESGEYHVEPGDFAAKLLGKL